MIKNGIGACCVEEASREKYALRPAFRRFFVGTAEVQHPKRSERYYLTRCSTNDKIAMARERQWEFLKEGLCSVSRERRSNARKRRVVT